MFVDSPRFGSGTTALPFVYQFAAGAIAGVTELLTLYPLGKKESPLFSLSSVGRKEANHRYHLEIYLTSTPLFTSLLFVPDVVRISFSLSLILHVSGRKQD